MADKVMFTKAVGLVPQRKGVFKDAMLDTTGFRLMVLTEEVEKKRCKKDSCEGCEYADDCDMQDKACGKPKKEMTEKSMRVHRQRSWGDDPEYDAVMRNFGMTAGKDGEPIEQHLVFGWANVTIQEDGTTPFDWQGDMIDTDVLETAAYNYVLNHGIANQEHMYGTECGWLVESMMFTKEKMAALGITDGTIPEGWFVGFYIPDGDVYEKVKNGEYNMFSIEGTGHRIPLDGGKEIY